MPDIYLPAGENGLSHAEGRARYTKGPIKQEIKKTTLK